MINISKSGNAIKFVFTDSDHYMYGNGEIVVPVNSLSLVIDESNMVTFRKANSNDIFLSFNPSNSNLSDKAGVIDFYKSNMVGSTGGGTESGITSGDVQTMIDNSLVDYYTDDEVDAALSGKADASDVTALENEVAAKADTSAVTAVNNALTAHTTDTGIHVNQQEKDGWNAKLDASAYTPVDLSEYWTSAQTEASIEAATSGKADTSAVTSVANDVSTVSGQVATKVATSDFNAYSAATDARIAEDEEVTAAALNDLQENKADTSAVTAVNDALTAHTSDTGIHVTQADKTSWNAKAEPYSAGTGIEISGNVISATGGGGATYSAGTNISIDTANTINCTLPIWVGTTNASALILNDTSNRKEVYKKHNGNASISYGSYSNALQPFSLAGGRYVEANNYAEVSVGFFNQSNGSSDSLMNNSGNTLFSVGNGTATKARHNAFEIRQNGDIYVNDGTNDVRLQDTILALGGLKLVKISQSDYDQLATKDPDTLYIISNVVS